MKSFTTRVELHRAGNIESYYEILHAAMKDQGFTKNMLDEKGILVKLPTVEYNFQADVTAQHVLGKAEIAAQSTKLKYSILVTESNSQRASVNLEPDVPKKVFIRVHHPAPPNSFRK
jgi:hypothetical protein